MSLDVLLINPPYLTPTSVVGVGHQVPLGLLMVGGALLDAGFTVRLLDAECRHLGGGEILAAVRRWRPRVVMTGHAGSTPAHGTCVEMFRAIKGEFPEVVTVYGGPFPTYHAGEILRGQGPAGLGGRSRGAVDVIVRGEGEATAVELVRTVLSGEPLDGVGSIAFLTMGEDGRGGAVAVTPERPPLRMDDYRIGWELLDANGSWDDYQCFGLGRAVIVQLSRGCPHGCTYCGQRGFWVKWRHRDPVALAGEIEWLVRKRGVRFVTLADENPTTIKAVWETFLREVARRELPVKFFATIRATDIVRDAAMLPLWKAAGVQYLLMGIETTDAATVKAVRKGSSTRVDFTACRLLRENGIFSMIGFIVGLGEERWGDYWRAHRQLAAYDGDYLNAMYVTPHAWTAFAETSRGRPVVDEDLAHWNYRRPVLGGRHMGAWETFLAVKLLELAFHLRPARLRRLLSRDAFSRQQFWWGVAHMGAVWAAEIGGFLRARPRGAGRTLAAFYGAALGESRHAERLVSLRFDRAKRTAPAAPQGAGSDLEDACA